MSTQTLSFTEQARRERRRARRSRVASIVMFVVAGLFVVLGVFFLIATGKPTSLITISSALIIASSGFTLRMTASTNDDTARRFDRLAEGGF